MRVLHICSDYFLSPLYENLFNVLQSIEINNEVFTLSFKNTTYSAKKSGDIKILRKRFTIFDRVLFFRKQKIIFNEICEECSLKEINIVHAHTLFSAGFSAFLLNKKFGLPYIVTIRNTDVNIFFKYMFHLRSLGRKIINNAQNIIFLSPAYRDFVIHQYIERANRRNISDKALVIPNGIDSYFIENKNVIKKKIKKDHIKLIYIGDINSNKNIETTIKACKLFLKKGFIVRYTVIGKILEAKYKKIISKHDFIDYHINCPKEEVVSFLRESDIFIMPSIFESFGLVYAEAMSQGLPVIYSKGQGFDGQFNDGVVGYAVNSLDYKDIYNKILDLYADYQQFSERCITLVEKFNWASIAHEYKQLYEFSAK
jgi:glycosyltransferase involved in cell wall biosynthesis